MRAIALLMITASFAIADDLKDLKGTWIIEKMEIEGGDLSESFKGTALVIDGGKYSVTVGKATDSGTLSVDGKKTPKTMDIKGVEGPNSGKTFLCIYELKDGKLTVCYSLDEKVRPTEFKTAKESKTLLAVYKKK